MQSPYGPPTEPSKAPEAISRAVASLPPEQMFELMKQMKVPLACFVIRSVACPLYRSAVCLAVHPEQSERSEEHAASESAIGLRSSAGASGDAHR